jgi:hypothetical protein
MREVPMPIENRRPLPAEEVVVHVPKGSANKVKIEESDEASLPSEITVQVSKNRTAGRKPVLGVIVK